MSALTRLLSVVLLGCLLLVAGCSEVRSFFDSGDPTPLELAVINEDERELRALLDAGADPNETRRGISIISTAVYYQEPEMIQILIEAGGKIYGDERDGFGWGELVYPDDDGTYSEVSAETFAFAEYLLEIGFSPCRDIADGFPPTAPELAKHARSASDREVVRRLEELEAGCEDG